MLTIKPHFAEQIIAKYSGVELYYFDDSSLVFFKERMRVGGGASSAYNTELTLKLLLMFQNYKQSGQHLNINWNMISNAVLKAAADMPKQVELSVREVFSHTESRLEADTARLEQLEKETAVLRFAAGLNANITGQGQLQNVIWSLLNKDITERQEHSGMAPKIIGSVGKERLKLRQDRLERLREKDVTAEHLTEWFKTLNEQETLKIYEAFTFVTSMTPEIHRQLISRKQVYSKNAAGPENAGLQQNVLIQAVENNPKYFLELIKNSLENNPMEVFSGTNDNAAKIITVSFRKHERQIFNNVERAITKQNEDIWEKRRIFGHIEVLIDSAAGSPREAAKLGTKLLEILKDNYKTNIHTHALELSQEEQNILELSENAVRIFRENPQALGSIRALINHVDESHREELRIWSENQLKNIAAIHREQPLSNRVMTIMENRFTEPGLARQAEKELFDILRQDLFIQEQELVWKKDTRREEGPLGIQEMQQIQERMKLFLSNRENVELLRKRIDSSSEKGLEHLRTWVNKYQSVISEQKEKNQLKETSQLISENRTETVLKLLQSEKRLELEKQELVKQIRSTLGENPAKQLEHYFARKNQVTGQELTDQTSLHVDETVKNIINSYMEITKKEDTLSRLNPGSYVHLANRLRENIHEPASKTVTETKRNLNILTAMMHRDYDFNQEQSRFFSVLTEQLGTRSEEILLNRNINNSINMTNTADASNIPQKVLELSAIMRMSHQNVSQSGLFNELGETKKEFLKKQRSQETKLEETRTTIKKISEKLEIQEKLVTELKKQSRQTESIPQLNINKLTKEIMKKMETDLRLEKMRHGLL